MKFCRYCGAQVSDDAAFCPNCGSSLQESPAGSGNGYQQGPPPGPGNRYQQGSGYGYQQGPPPGPGSRYQQGPGYGYQPGPLPGPGSRYQQGPGYRYQQGAPAGPGYGKPAKKVKKGGILGSLVKVAVGAVAITAGVAVVSGVVGEPGGGSGGGGNPTYGAYQQAGGQAGGNSGSGKKGSPISGGRLVSCNKPLRVLNETGYREYELMDAIDEYGKNAPSHIEVLPANNTVSINGDKITIKLPNVAFKSTCSRVSGVSPQTMLATRDELTIYGTITESGETVEGELYEDFERTGNRQVYYAAGPIDKIDGIAPNGAFTAGITDPATGSYEHISLKNTYSHPRTGETSRFSKFSLDYFPEDDYYMLSIFLYGDGEENRYYSTLEEDEYSPHVDRPYPDYCYTIMLISDYSIRMASQYAVGIWK